MFNFLSKNAKLPFGLDVGYTSVRAVQLAKKGKLVHLAGYGEAPIKEGVLSQNGINTDELAFSINQVMRNSNINPITSRRVVCALPEADTFVKNIQLQKTEDDELGEVIKFELEKIVPLPISDLYLDWKKTKEGEKKEKDNIIIVAAPKRLINSYVEALKKAKLEIVALDIEAGAVSRALIKRDEQDKGAYLIIDMGADTTTITIHDFGSIQLTGSTHTAGNEITDNLAKHLDLDKKKAEEVKRHVISSGQKMKPKLFEITVKPILAKLAKEAGRSISYYTNYIKSPHKIKRILLSGGNAQLSGMAEFFEDRFKIKTEIGNPWNNVTAYPLKALPKIKASLYTTAIGLALRELIEE